MFLCWCIVLIVYWSDTQCILCWSPVDRVSWYSPLWDQSAVVLSSLINTHGLFCMVPSLHSHSLAGHLFTLLQILLKTCSTEQHVESGKMVWDVAGLQQCLPQQCNCYSLVDVIVCWLSKLFRLETCMEIFPQYFRSYPRETPRVREQNMWDARGKGNRQGGKPR